MVTTFLDSGAFRRPRMVWLDDGHGQTKTVLLRAVRKATTIMGGRAADDMMRGTLLRLSMVLCLQRVFAGLR